MPLMLPSTALYKTHIRGPHQRISRIDSFDIDGNVLVQDVPIISGSVNASVNNRVTRRATWALTDEYYPVLPTDVFAPEIAVVRISSGVRYGNGTTELFPIFTGRVQTADRRADGSVQFTADDLANDVVEFRFEAPQPTRVSAGVGVPAQTVLGEIEKLITQAIPSAVFGTHGVDDAALPYLIWDEDRGQALDDLAGALGGRWVLNGAGEFSVQPIVYGPGTSVATLSDNTLNDTMVTSAGIAKNRSGVANSVTVVAERADGGDPVRVTVRDTDPTSATFFGGPFGKVSIITKIQTPLFPSEAQRLARATLQSSVALISQWDTNVVPDFTLEPGDTVTLGWRGLTGEQVLDQITYPLLPQGAMRLTSRGTVIVTDA